MNTPSLPHTTHTPQKYTGPSAAEVLAQRKQFLNPGIFLYYNAPIMLVEGKGSTSGMTRAGGTSTVSVASSPSAWGTAIRT